MINFTFAEIALIIFSQIILLFLFNLFIRKDSKKHDIFKDKLELLESIFTHTKHDKIVNLEDIKKIELDDNIKTVNVFSQDIYRDVKDNGQFSDEKYNVGTFYETVSKNISNNTSYNYFLKKDANFRHSLISFFSSHPKTENIDFIIIPSNKYYFYDEVYLYEYDKPEIEIIDGKKHEIKARAYEFLPSISNEDEELLYYLELDEKQIERLLQIKEKLFSKYCDISKNEIELIKSKIGEFSKI
jgi:uncharacterized protein (UPF0216 family)